MTKKTDIINRETESAEIDFVKLVDESFKDLKEGRVVEL
jgi:hypothetical protein